MRAAFAVCTFMLFALCSLCGLTPAQAQNTICPTAPPGTSDNRCASTAFVQSAIAGAIGIGPLPDANIWIGNSSNAAVPHPVSGDCTMTDTGVFTCTPGTVSISQGAGIIATPNPITGTGTIAVDIATGAQFQSDTANKPLDPTSIWNAATLTSLTDASTIAINFSAGIDFTVTLGGNRTLGNPSNMKVGQTGCIFIVQDATGSRTLAYASNWKFAGGSAPVLTTAANAVDMLCYFVRSSTFVIGTLTAGLQ